MKKGTQCVNMVSKCKCLVLETLQSVNIQLLTDRHNFIVYLTNIYIYTVYTEMTFTAPSAVLPLLLLLYLFSCANV